ncbi:MAG: hypothetical protein Tp1124SUR272871_12 [Prokaryotic dsDNA virus sp.]|jgi:hypothetical protein|nr:MAG: hypothetical protein Tp1125SUR00d2C35834131_26 [Prokaryotic dsDNA virus sp.]QDP67332.1 MAG: hypothetical protein Tp1124SUR272871_12 [Prokaryotic dsDNA virus sp.]|tara:strand:- start:277 stop:594 length:318 start_codon:yes stop_codon:yes gene_type:complete
MQLYTKKEKTIMQKNWEIEQNTGEMQNPVIKLFNPSGLGTWFISSLSPDETLSYGVAKLFENEIGSIDMEGLKKTVCPPFGLPIEKDLYFSSQKYSIEDCLHKDL